MRSFSFFMYTEILPAPTARTSIKIQGNMDETKPVITKVSFGTVDGKEVFLYTLTNNKGNQVKITNYGGIMTSWTAPDRNGKKTSIVVGFDSLAPYLKQSSYFGALIGRYANRIAKGKFSLDAVEYTLAANNGNNHLHGGNKGFDKSVWDAEIINDSKAVLLLSYLSKDGEEGYPGNLQVRVRYAFTNDDELEIEYNAVADKPTVINLTQHNYYNLTGDVSNTILDHKLMIAADAYIPIDTDLIPVGSLEPVKGTAFDFTVAKKIGAGFNEVEGGYDHTWVLNGNGGSLNLAALLSDSISGRRLAVYTGQPGIQFYSGNFLDGQFKTDYGKPINLHSALCLETQHFPDSPNRPLFPSTVLRPGEKYHTITKYKVGVE